MFSFFRPPTFSDPALDERARVLFFSIALIALGCIAAGVFGAHPAPTSLDPRLLPIAYTVSPLALICIELNRRGFVSIAAWLFLSVFIVLNWARATTFGGIYSPNLVMLAVMTLFACVTLGPRAGMATALACIGVTLTLVFPLREPAAASFHIPLMAAWTPPCLAVICTLFLARISLDRTATALQATRQELAVRQAAERKLSLALKSGAIGAYDAELDGDWIVADEQMLKIIGGAGPPGAPLPRDAIIGLIHPDDAARLVEATASLRHGAESFRVEVRLAAPGEERHIEVASTVFVEPSGARSQIGTVTDLSERRLAEAERRKLEAQLRSAEQMRAIGIMARGIAHDFNNILGAIAGFSSLLEENLPAGSPEHGFAVRISDASNRGRAVVDQILSFAKLETEPRSVVDLAELIGGLRPLLESLVAPTVVLEVAPFPGGLWCEVNAGQFTQVLTNLCKNASDALGDRPGRVTIQVRRLTAAVRAEFSMDVRRGRAQMTGALDPGADYVVIGVSDDGPGIPRENLHRLFEPFYTTKAAGEGTGLGLSVVQSAAESHGGVCVAQSEPERGSCFSVVLPLSLPLSRKAAAPDRPVGAGFGE